MERNPNPLVVSKKISKSDKYLPKPYLQKIYEICDHPQEEAYINFHAEVGVRVSDIVGQKRRNSNHRDIGLEVQNIDWQNNRAWIYDHKKNKWRWVFFPEKTKASLKRYMLWRQANDIQDRQLFPVSEKTCNRWLKKWAKKVEFPFAEQIGSHWLRHTFIRLSRASGRDIKAVQANTGDTIKTILEWYSDLSNEDMRKEIEGKPIT